MKTNLIGISGKIGSGKSTLSEMIEKHLYDIIYTNNSNSTIFNIEQKFFASNVKKIHELLTGHPGYTQENKNLFLEEYGFNVGIGLQKIGEGLRELYHPDVWIISTLTNLYPTTVTIINDCRYPNEVTAIKDRGGIVIRLNGDPAKVRENSLRDHNHSSEIALDTCDKFDIVFDNIHGLKELDSFAKKIVMDFCF